MRAEVPYPKAYVQALVNQFAVRAGIRPPRFCWSRRVKLASYFALSHTVHVNPRFAQHLPEDEFQAVLAHEIGHAGQRWMTLFLAAVDVLVNPFTLVLVAGLHPKPLWPILAMGLTLVIKWRLGPRIRLAKELGADAFCVRALGDEQPLLLLLQRLVGRGRKTSWVTRRRLDQLDKSRSPFQVD